MVCQLSQRIYWLFLAPLIVLAPLKTAAYDAQSLERLRVEGIQRSVFLNKSVPRFLEIKTSPDLESFDLKIGAILRQHCIPCHGPKKSKARLRIDKLNPNIIDGKDVDWWVEILAVLTNGEMPPPEESELNDQDRVTAIDWLSGEIRKASIARRAKSEHSSFRRMTRYEYNYALQDLLGLNRQFARDLPPEAQSKDGFKNSSEVLKMSVSQLEMYRKIARSALTRATKPAQKPPVFYWGISMEKRSQKEWEKQEAKMQEARSAYQDNPQILKDELAKLDSEFRKPRRGTHFKDLKTERRVPHNWSYYNAKYASEPSLSKPDDPGPFKKVAILPSGRNSKMVIELGDKLPDQGVLRVKVRASATESLQSKKPSMALEFGWQASNEGRALLKVSEEDFLITNGPDEIKTYQWDIPLGDIYPRNSVRGISKLGSMPSPSEHIRIVNSSASTGPGIQIYYVEIATPVYDKWPPESHERIFINSPNRNNETSYAKEIFFSFMPRAWRRPITPGEVSQKLSLFKLIRPSCDTFEEAIIEVLTTVLSSPNFLYLTNDDSHSKSVVSENVRNLSNYEIASRLAIFLWCSIPDKPLLDLAKKGWLKDENVLIQQVKRMLADSRSDRFSKQFVHQWLDMQLLDLLKPGVGINPMVKHSMQQEPIEFFREILNRNESILNFIHSDFAVLNEPLAHHYGYKNVFGNHFRRIQLGNKFQRGGLLTQAGLLAMNSSGGESNPLKRGIWMLESILNDPPPPPPPAVPEIDIADPEIAKMTLKERIADHRNHAACLSCHQKIDPWGIALENYDANGLWRDEEKGNPVDASSRLYNETVLDGVYGLKQFLLLNRQDQFVLAFVHKVSSFSLGRPLTIADLSQVEEIAAKVRMSGDGLVSVIENLVVSDLFLSK